MLPAYNEESSLPLLLESIQKLKFPSEDWHVVVVDDGSRDRTPDILKEWSSKLPLTILTHSPNQGLGRAMRTGFNYLAKTVTDDDAVVALDSDNTHPPELAVKMREKQKLHGLDIVIASRYASENGESGKEIGLAFHRKVLSRGAGIILQTAFRIKGAKDYTCGFRLYSGSILKKAVQVYGESIVEEPNFVCMVEILVKLAHIGAKIGEVPLVLRYDLKTSSSKMKIMRTIIRYFGMIWEYQVKGKLKMYRI